ncbi:YceD family protein [Siminovitchia fortis]|uniref:DUF177 domain-containing protein n=1 Tax=Siminovitchia fortis TaxID=254758 RepID=A0A443IQC9_9BACI|nr:DUF177 domain-containing protein [Siminovitchia fortis]RWR08207.1 DUF177 domain-containing protein [Siminovitchia fortis]WHY83406.1 DUF177 domain-containing protein [Siminovitchia fortis]
MKWTIAELHKYEYKAMTFDKTIDLAEELKKADPEIRAVSPIRVQGRADVDSHKVAFHLHITGTFTLPCSRTLADVEYPFDIHSIETFLLKPLDYEVDENEEIHEVEGGVIDLKPVVYELVLLEVPIQVFSPEAEKDASLPSGHDWEVMTEDQLYEAREREKEKIDPRLADLAKLLQKDEDEKQK